MIKEGKILRVGPKGGQVKDNGWQYVETGDLVKITKLSDNNNTLILRPLIDKHKADMYFWYGNNINKLNPEYLMEL